MVEAPSAPGLSRRNKVVEAISAAGDRDIEGGWRTVCNDPLAFGLDPLEAADWDVVGLALALCPDPTCVPAGLDDDVAAWLEAFGGEGRPTWPPSCARSAIHAGWTDPMAAAIFAEQVEAAGTAAEAVFDALWDPRSDEPVRVDGRTVSEAVASGDLSVDEVLVALA